MLRIWDYTLATPRIAPLRLGDAVVQLNFSADGRQLFAANGNNVTIVDLLDPRTPAPAWFVILAERLGGLHLNDEGVMQTVADRSLEPLRDAVLGSESGGDYERFGRWFFSLPAGKVRNINLALPSPSVNR